VGKGKEKNVEAHSHRYPGESDAVKDSGRRLDKLQKRKGYAWKNTTNASLTANIQLMSTDSNKGNEKRRRITEEPNSTSWAQVRKVYEMYRARV
jgi:hypothetical protein